MLCSPDSAGPFNYSMVKVYSCETEAAASDSGVDFGAGRAGTSPPSPGEFMSAKVAPVQRSTDVRLHCCLIMTC